MDVHVSYITNSFGLATHYSFENSELALTDVTDTWHVYTVSSLVALFCLGRGPDKRQAPSLFLHLPSHP